jgi:hypothetical protein
MMARYLIPANTVSLNDDIVDSVQKEFDGDLPSTLTLYQEIERWKVYCQEEKMKNIVSLTDALKIANPMLFPNISAILQLLLTLPVGSCSCERSFSAMRRLKTWQRSSMGETRFNGLALLNIHDGDDVGMVDPSAVLKRFDIGNRRIGQLFN